MQCGNIAIGIMAELAHPASVQITNQGPGILGYVVPGLIAAVTAIAGIWLTHRFTLQRERNDLKEKKEREQYFICTELVYLLEQFVERCIPVATDGGEYNEQGHLVWRIGFPGFDYDRITGDWRMLPPELLYRLREMIVLQEESARWISDSFENEDEVKPLESFSIRQYQAVRLGIKAKILARKLRELCKMPSGTRRHDQRTAAGALLSLWRKHHKGEVDRIRLRRAQMAAVRQIQDKANR